MKRLTTNQGEVFTTADAMRAKGQLEIVREIMQDGAWLTLVEITALANRLHLERTGKESHWGEAAISARIRNLRQAIGGHPPRNVERRQGANGWTEYRATVIDPTAPSAN